MIRKMAPFAFAVTISILAVSNWAQGAQKTVEKKVIAEKAIAEKKIIAEKRPAILAEALEINSVTKNDKGAEANPNAAGILVPVDLRWKLKLPQGARLVQVNAVLRTRNTDKSTTDLKKVLEVKAGITQGGILLLPMPDGVFASEFTLTLNARMVMPGDNGEQIATRTKSGKFPSVIAE
ncbi:MAG: hypothetical protein ABI882_19560 [Acidobacteriota bacterium]